MKKQTEVRLIEIARRRFGELLEDNSVPEDDIARLVIGTIKRKKSLMVRIDLLPPPRQIDAAEMFIDAYLDNKQLCTLEVDEETEQVTVTTIMKCLGCNWIVFLRKCFACAFLDPLLVVN